MSQMSAPSQDVRLYRALKQHFGFDAFRPGQQGVVRDALEGRDVLAIMPTGGGKSLCFQLPALLRPGLTLVVSPLIALMQDQVRQLRANGIPADLLNSAQDAAASAEVMRQLDQGALKLLYVAPERLLMDGFLSRLTRHGSLSMLVVDEAHCVSEWGHDFRPEYRQLHRVREAFPEVPVLAFTATATPRVRDDIGVQLHLNAPALHLASFNRGNLFYAVEEKTRDAYTRVREQARRGGSGIVYCGSRRRVDELAARLADDGVEALPYHAGLGAEVRREHQERFIGDAAQVMVATVAFGMGINKPDVRWVIHYDLPKTLEAYYQEAGRAGRDGEPGECTLLYSPGDIHSAEQLIRNKVHPATGEPLEQEQRIARQQLREVIDYAESAVCRRVVQLRYFGETFEPPCGQCDNCIAPRPVSDCTIAAQQLLSAVARLAQRAACPVAIIRSRRDGTPQTDGVITVVLSDEPANDDLVRVAMHEGRLRGATVRQIDQRTDSWVRRYPDVHVEIVTDTAGLRSHLDNTESDPRIGLAVVGPADTEALGSLTIPNSHPIHGFPDCSVLVVRG